MMTTYLSIIYKHGCLPEVFIPAPVVVHLQKSFFAHHRLQ